MPNKVLTDKLILLFEQLGDFIDYEFVSGDEESVFSVTKFAFCDEEL